jgi:hypothetical protein
VAAKTASSACFNQKTGRTHLESINTVEPGRGFCTSSPTIAAIASGFRRGQTGGSYSSRCGQVLL